MLELFIESVLSLLEGPLTGIGISPVAVLRGVELFIIVLLTVFGSYFVRRFVRTLKMRAEKVNPSGMTHSLLPFKARRGHWFGSWVCHLRSNEHLLVWISRRFLARYVLPW